MKQLSLVLNVVLLAAVGFLYYLHFSDKKVPEKKAKVSQVVAANANGNLNKPLLAYVELDSLNEKITYIKTKRKELEAEQQSIEAEWENGYKRLESRKNEFLKRANATEEEANKLGAELAQEQQRIDYTKQTKSQSLSERSYKFMDDLQKRLRKFLEDYNQDKQFQYIFSTGNGLDYMVYKDSSLNITQDVVDGMNEQMKTPAKK